MRERKSIRARAPQASSPEVRRVMQRNTGRETSIEKLLAASLHNMGLRFRKDAQMENDLKIKADIVFPRNRICIFVDGCFWHGCPYHLKAPKTHASWWKEKIKDNRKRDERQTQELQSRGWTVLRYWEHDVTPENLLSVCSEIGRLVKIGQENAGGDPI
jgi:DNA mismatch endonuclease (patch repair protein)